MAINQLKGTYHNHASKAMFNFVFEFSCIALAHQCCQPYTVNVEALRRYIVTKLI